MSFLVQTSTLPGALEVVDTDDPRALRVTESTLPGALRVRQSTLPGAMRVRGLFSPSQLPGLAAWYDAADSSTVLTTVGPDVPATDGQTVRRWLDKSGNNRHLDQADLALQPIFTNAATGLTFDGTNDFLNGGDVNDIREGNWFVGVVAKYTAGNAAGTVLAKSRFGAQTGRWAVTKFNTTTLEFFNDIASDFAGATRPFSSTNRSIFSGVYVRGDGLYLRVNQAQSSVSKVAVADLDSPTRFLVGAYNNATDSGQQAGLFLNGQICEVVLADLSDFSTVARCETYLARKWGITL
jgi:hypothetical protein